MLGELAAMGTAVCWSLTAVFFSYSGRKIGSDVVNRSRLIFALMFLAVMHLLLEGSLFPQNVAPYRWWWLGVSGILGLVLGDTFLFRAYVMVGPRLSMLMMSSVPIFSVVFGWLLFGETISSLEMVGILLAVGGIGWVVTEKQNGLTVVENKAYKAGLFFALLGALGQVANLVTAKFGLAGGYPTISATMIRLFVAVIVLWAFAALRGQVRYTFRQWRNKEAFPAMLAGSFTGPFLGIWLSLVAVSMTRLGIASTLMALPPVILIPVEYFILKRPVSNRGIIGTLVAFVGVMMLFVNVGG
ncbi:MAG: DMT family transporter [Anaerolineae bacterium]|nr:DMT family transporter [Anaerolineae bacterium]